MVVEGSGVNADGKRNGKMQAGEVEKVANNLCDFGGIFQLQQLKYVKIISYPVSFIILAYGHWLGIYLTDQTVEVMDSTGHLGKDGLHTTLKQFLRSHIYNKTFTITPRLQSDQSNICALYTLSFLYYRTFTGRSLCSFSKLFTADTKTNCNIIKKIYETILKLEK